MLHHAASEELQPVGPDNPGFDPGEPNAKGLAIFIFVFVVLLVVIFAGTTGYFNWAWERQTQEAVLGKPSEDLADLRAREDLQLKTYGYINKEKGRIQLPIERAMELVAAEAAAGKPKYPTVATPVKKIEEVPVAAAAAPAVGKN
jgi:hypothetical protein